MKDSAQLHVGALIDPEVENERILAVAHPFNCNDTLASLRKLYPNTEFPNNIKDNLRNLSKLDNRRGEELLKKLEGQAGRVCKSQFMRILQVLDEYVKG